MNERRPSLRPGACAAAMLLVLLASSLAGAAALAEATAPQRADTYYTYCLARQAWYRKEYTEALRLMSEACEGDPGSADLRVDLARLRLDLNQTAEAMVDLRQAITLDPTAAAPRRLLADTLLTTALREGTTPALVDQTIEAYRETIRIDPSDAEAQMNLGKLLASRSRYPEALEAFNAHLALEPLSEEGLTLAAQVLIKLDRQKEAVALLADALVKRADSAPLNLAYLDALEAAGDTQGVEKAAAAMIKAGLEPMRAHFTMARLLSARKDHSGAYDHLSELYGLLDKQPSNVTDEDRAGIQLRMIQELIEADRIAEAMQLSRAGSVRFPADIRFLLREGEALLLSGKTAEAETLFRNEVLGQSQDSARSHQVSDVYLAVGARSESKGRLEEAETSLKASIEWNPVNSSALNYLGFMLADRGVRLDEAIKYISLALERDPGNGAYLDSLGWAYFKRGEYSRAEELLVAAAAAMAQESEIHDHLGDLYQAMGRTDDAIKAWENALQHATTKAGSIQSKLDAARRSAPGKP